MNRIKILYFLIFFLIIVLFIMYLIYRVRKKQEKPCWYINMRIAFILYIMFVFGFAFISFDNHNRAYILDNGWKYSSYYTEDGKEYIVTDLVENDNGDILSGYMVHENERYSLDEVYLTSQGVLIIDTEQSYQQVEQYVYVNQEKERVYDMKICYWNVFGQFKILESKGFYIGNVYLKPVVWDLDLSFNDISIQYLILLFLTSTAFIPLLWRIAKCIFSKFNKRQHQECEKASHLLVQICATALILGISVLSQSFPMSFILLMFYILLGWIIIRFVQASIQIGTIFDKESKRFKNRYTLKEYILDSDKKEALKWQIYFVKLSLLYYFIWIFICVLKCV